MTLHRIGTPISLSKSTFYTIVEDFLCFSLGVNSLNLSSFYKLYFGFPEKTKNLKSFLIIYK